MDENLTNKESGGDYLTCSEVAKEIKMSDQTLRTWILLGKIDPSKCFQAARFGHWRIHRSALKKILQDGH